MKTSNFQLILLAAFIVFILGGVLIFAGLGKGGGAGSGATVVIWGTEDHTIMDAVIKKFSLNTATYVQKDSSTYESDFTKMH